MSLSSHSHIYEVTVGKQSVNGVLERAICSCGHWVDVKIAVPNRNAYKRAYNARKKQEVLEMKQELARLKGSSRKRTRSRSPSPPRQSISDKIAKWAAAQGTLAILTLKSVKSQLKAKLTQMLVLLLKLVFLMFERVHSNQIIRRANCLRSQIPIFNFLFLL